MAGLLTTLPPVKPVTCQSQLTFTEWNRTIEQLIQRDRKLEESFLLALNSLDITALSALLGAVNVILGSDLIGDVELNGVLPIDLSNFAAFQRDAIARIAVLEANQVAQDEEGNDRSLKSLVLNSQSSIAAVNVKLDDFQTELDAIKAITDQVTAIKTFVDGVEARLTDAESLIADFGAEIKNARKEFADDPSKRLVDKITAMDAQADATTEKLAVLVKEVTDARAPDRFDTLAERVGSLESDLEDLRELITDLRGRGTVTGIKVGRSVLHGVVELLPGGNIAVTRERNGYRMDVVDEGTCVDLAAPKIDPNNGQCGPKDPNFGN